MPFGKVLIIMFAFKAPVGEKRCHSLHFPFWWVGNDSFVLSLLPPAGSALGKWRCSVGPASDCQCGETAFLTVCAAPCVLLRVCSRCEKSHSDTPILCRLDGICSYSYPGLTAIETWLFVSLSIVTKIKRIF